MLGFVWMLRKSNLPNHTWDCFVYNAAALDMICYEINLTDLGEDRINYEAFWEHIWKNEIFFYNALDK